MRNLTPGFWMATGILSWDSASMLCTQIFDFKTEDHSRKATSLPLTLWIVEHCYEQRRVLGFESAGLSSHLYSAMARVDLIATYYTIEEQDAIYRRLILRKKFRSTD